MCNLKNLAQLYVKQYFPEYLNRVERIWGMLDNIDLNTSPKYFQLGGTLGFAAGASQELREVVSGIIAIRVTYEQEKDNTFIPPQELQELIREACEKLKVSPSVKVKLEKVTIDFNNENSSNDLVNELTKTIRQEHSETRKVIKKPVISSKHKFNCLVTLYPIQREILFELGFNDITIKLPKTKFELFNAIADHNAKSKGWADWERIALKVPQWSNNNKINKSPDYVRSRIIDLRKELPSELDGFIEGKQGHGYRLSTHPDNIYFDKAQL
jgi:hypothetical protein